jgi:hypothetical protein
LDGGDHAAQGKQQTILHITLMNIKRNL